MYTFTKRFSNCHLSILLNLPSIKLGFEKSTGKNDFCWGSFSGKIDKIAVLEHLMTAQCWRSTKMFALLTMMQKQTYYTLSFSCVKSLFHIILALSLSQRLAGCVWAIPFTCVDKAARAFCMYVTHIYCHSFSV